MISAAEARKITDNSINTTLENVENKIRNAAECGGNSIMIDFVDVNGTPFMDMSYDVRKATLSELKKSGYWIEENKVSW